MGIISQFISPLDSIFQIKRISFIETMQDETKEAKPKRTRVNFALASENATFT
jgi:hypothetical protein